VNSASRYARDPWFSFVEPSEYSMLALRAEYTRIVQAKCQVVAKKRNGTRRAVRMPAPDNKRGSGQSPEPSTNGLVLDFEQEVL